MDALPLPLAAPSWVIPGSIADNARFLAGKVSEIGLCFFESTACLAYTDQDLPGDLADLPLSWHVHLPLGLPWAQGQAGAVAMELLNKTAFLKATRAVLHLPPGLGAGSTDPTLRRFLLEFVEHWELAGRRPTDLLLENQVGDAFNVLLDLADRHGCGLCLDLSHWLLSKNAREMPKTDFLNKVGLVHLNAPGEKKDGHGSLLELSPAEADWARALLGQLRAKNKAAQALETDSPLLMLEVFSWDKLQSSLPVLNSWLSY